MRCCAVQGCCWFLVVIVVTDFVSCAGLSLCLVLLGLCPGYESEDLFAGGAGGLGFCLGGRMGRRARAV